MYDQSDHENEQGFDSCQNNNMNQNSSNRLSIFISKRDAHTEAWRQSLEFQKQASVNGAKNSAKNAKKTPQKQPPRMNWSSWRRTADTICHSKRRIRHNFIEHSCYKNAWPQQALNIQNICYVPWENYVFFLSTRRKTSCAKKPVAAPVTSARAKSTGA